MKKCILFSYIALFLSFLVSARAPAASVTESPAPSVSAELPEPSLSPKAAKDSIRLLLNGECIELPMREYLRGVLAAEMPASFETEALKAQTVAARTYALYCSASGKHKAADVCSDPACCQAYLSEDELREKWGSDFAVYSAKLEACIDETQGEYLSYRGVPIFAAFHSSSAGYTEASGNIWSPLPYLVSVSSPESEATVPNYISRVEVSPLDFRDTLLHEHPELDFSMARRSWVGTISRDESGRVLSALIGGGELSGTELRALFSLRSTAFTIDYSGSAFVFTVTGFGHGVGMSQYGANTMAASGSDYREILAHYYPGTVLESVT